MSLWRETGYLCPIAPLFVRGTGEGHLHNVKKVGAVKGRSGKR